jgi:predicted type IV restriction endonuclease
MAQQNDSASQAQNLQLRQCIVKLIPKITKYRDRPLGEENTKTTLIDPILDVLGWNVRNEEEVDKEFKAKRGYDPVDYALMTMGKPRLFIEAKGLGENLDEHKWAAQVVSYAATAGVTWCVLTNGDEYRFYNSTTPVDAEEKEFCRVRLSANADEAADVLALVSRGNLDRGIIDERLEVHFVDRRVKQALTEMLESQDKDLVWLIRRKAPEPKLTPRQITASLGRLVRGDLPGLRPTISSAASAPDDPFPPQWPAWKKALEGIESQAVKGFFLAQVKLGTKSHLNCCSIDFRVGRKCRWSAFARKKHLYIWQVGRFKGDEEFWKKKVGVNKVKPVSKGQDLTFNLETADQMRAFEEAVKDDLSNVEFVGSDRQE